MCGCDLMSCLLSKRPATRKQHITDDHVVLGAAVATVFRPGLYARQTFAFSPRRRTHENRENSCNFDSGTAGCCA